jgi:hypothetical protein
LVDFVVLRGSAGGDDGDGDGNGDDDNDIVGS